MDSPSGRLDEAMDARSLDLDLKWDEVAAAARISPATLRAIRRGTNQPSRRTKRRIETALQWEPGSIDDILAGGQPTPIDRPPTKPTQPPSVEELAEVIERLEAKSKQLEAKDAQINADLAEVKEQLRRFLGNGTEQQGNSG